MQPDLPESFFADNGYVAHRVAADGTILGVLKMGANWRLCVGMDYFSPGNSYCYKFRAVAIAAMNSFDPATDADPVDWFKHVNSNRCRINGDPARESIGWPASGHWGDVR